LRKFYKSISLQNRNPRDIIHGDFFNGFPENYFFDFDPANDFSTPVLELPALLTVDFTAALLLPVFFD